MFFSSIPIGLLSALASSIFVSVALYYIFKVERGGGQIGIFYTLLAIMYFALGAPLNAILAGVAATIFKSRLFLPFCLALLAVVVFLACTELIAHHFLNLRHPHTDYSHVHTYYPIVVLIALFSAPVVGISFQFLLPGFFRSSANGSMHNELDTARTGL